MHASSSAGPYFLLGVSKCKAARCREVERDEGMVKLVKDIQGSDPMASALLVECRGRTPEALEVCRAESLEFCMCLCVAELFLMFQRGDGMGRSCPTLFRLTSIAALGVLERLLAE